MRALLPMSRGLLAAALLLVLPQGGLAENALFTITPGGGVCWPDVKLDLKSPAGHVGGILGVRVAPVLAIEGRGNFVLSEDDPGGTDREIAHAEGNLTLFAFPESPVQPYLTGGAGVIRLRSENELAVNGGVGLASMFNKYVGFRVDARDVAYQLNVGSGDEWVHTYEIFAGISFGFGGTPKDTDLDGVPDKDDRCPGTPVGARVDFSGCPLDGDGDGVFDGLDQCADTPRGATVDAGGCPRDSDGDGVYDGLDRCVATPPGAKVDAMGCPTDSDGDGVYDGIDQCPATPRDAVVDAKGCPRDADGDGIYDGIDQCPGTPPGTMVDYRGCPITQVETELRERGEIRLRNVNFVTGSAELRPESHEALDEVGEILTRYPDLRIEIGGHTDSQGSEEVNQRLSEARAQSVLNYLLNAFPQLLRSNFTVFGYGESRPIASNETAEGRAENRRVEFRVLNPEVME